MPLPFPLPINHGQSRYAIVRGITRRARHLYDGAPSLLPATSLKPCRTALDEHRAGLLAFRIVARARVLVMPKPAMLVRIPTWERNDDRCNSNT